MFDIGFTEIVVVGVVALIVVGPEKLPDTIRTGMAYIKQFKSGVANIRDEVERGLELDEMKNEFHKSKNDFSQSVGFGELDDSIAEFKKEANDLNMFSGLESAYTEHAIDADIEADLAHLDDRIGPQLPSADSEAETGIEHDAVVEAYRPNSSQDNISKRADS